MRWQGLLAAAFAVTGCGARGSLGIPTEDVTGTIVDVTKAPLPGVQVLVGGTLTTTDEAGRFTVHDVSLPYDLAIDSSTSDEPFGYVYLGMTDPAPTVVLRLLFAPGTQHGSATLTGVPAPVESSPIQASMLVEPTDNLAWFDLAIVTTSPSQARSLQVSWAGAPSAAVRLHAFQMQADPATKAPLHYIGYDTTFVVLQDKATVMWSASYKPPPFQESPLSVTVSMPEGYTIGPSDLSMRTAGSAFYGGPMAVSSAAGPEVSFMVPDLAGAVFEVAVGASNGTGMSARRVPGLAAGTQGLAVQVDPAPTLISPSNGGTLGVGSTVAWNAGGPGTLYSTLGRVTAAGPNFVLWGGDGSATVPDLSALGLPLPHGEKYVLWLDREGAAATVEDLASSVYPATQLQKPLTFAMAASIDVTTP